MLLCVVVNFSLRFNCFCITSAMSCSRVCVLILGSVNDPAVVLCS